jgi:hypothetical protein
MQKITISRTNRADARSGEGAFPAGAMPWEYVLIVYYLFSNLPLPHNLIVETLLYRNNLHVSGILLLIHCFCYPRVVFHSCESDFLERRGQYNPCHECHRDREHCKGNRQMLILLGGMLIIRAISDQAFGHRRPCLWGLSRSRNSYI